MLARTQSVSELTNTISDLLESNLKLKNIAVEGQISNLSKSSAGHYYFNLIDEESLIQCAFFRMAAAKNTVELKEGASLIVCGNVRVYKKSGVYQIQVSRVLESKESYLQRLYLELKKKLEKKGYFSMDRKRPLPLKIRKIGLITSKNSAAIRDFLTILKPRNPFIEIYLIDVRVQGKTAAFEISEAIKYFQGIDDLDLIVVTRGGGSKEDLFVFNDESICEAAFLSRIPVLSAIGHEIDRSLLDDTADIYCSTPTAAAQRISDSLYLSMNTLPIKQKTLKSALEMRLSYERMLLDTKNRGLKNALIAKVKEGKFALTQYRRTMLSSVQSRFKEERLKLEHSIKLLDSYNIDSVLSRGFAIIKKDGRAVVSFEDLQVDEYLELDLKEFTLRVQLKEIQKKLEGGSGWRK